MFTALIMLHILICVALIIVVLMQSAKGEGLAGAFGGGGGVSGAVFGGRGAASFLSKATTILAVAFMVSCLVLSIMSAGRSGLTGEETESAVTRAAREAQQGAAQQQQNTQGVTTDQGQTDNAEDIFNTPAASDSN